MATIKQNETRGFECDDDVDLLGGIGNHKSMKEKGVVSMCWLGCKLCVFYFW
jgi:hypothetical protein